MILPFTSETFDGAPEVNHGETFPDPRQSERRWFCWHVDGQDLWMVCGNTNAFGIVRNASANELTWAADTWHKAKPWPHASRVTLQKELSK